MSKILLVEDDMEISTMLKNFLTTEKFEVITAYDGKSALDRFFSDSFSLVLLDLMIPQISGMEVMEKIRENSTVPIIIISAKDTDSDKTLGLGLGADDYITKPFDNEELLARIKVHLESSMSNSNILVYKDITLNVEDYKVTVLNKNLDLTKNEFMLLKVLMENRNQVLTKDKLFRLVWDYNDLADDNTLNVHISKLRNKIKCITNEDYIETVWSIGYRLKK